MRDISFAEVFVMAFSGLSSVGMAYRLAIFFKKKIYLFFCIRVHRIQEDSWK